MILDDYDFVFQEGSSSNTAVGIDAFLTVFQSQITILHQTYQVLVKKKPSAPIPQP